MGGPALDVERQPWERLDDVGFSTYVPGALAIGAAQLNYSETM